MLKKHYLYVALTQQLIDVLITAASFMMAYFFRFEILPDGMPGPIITFAKISLIPLVLTIYFFHKNGLYKSHRFSSRSREIWAVTKANTQMFVGFVIALYFMAPERISRIMLVSFWIISFFTHVGTRIVVRNTLRTIRRKGRNLRHILLIGNGQQMEEYVHQVRAFKDAGIRILAWIDSNGKADEMDILDPLQEDILIARKEYEPDWIVVAYPGEEYQKLKDVLRLLHNDVVDIQVLPELPYSIVGNHIEEFGSLPIMNLNSPSFSFFDLLTKRLFDVLASTVGILLISPILLVLAILVKLTSKGPIIYGQKRMGMDGKTFTMWKFRSMKVDADSSENPGWTTKDDPRRTSIGKFLRSTSLDELPQLFNVLFGQMSLVGPRPEQPYYVEKFRHDIPAYMLRHRMKAGITGWAQINGWRGDTSLEKRIECDIFYIKNWSLWLDIKILFLTFWKGFINKNAY